ncbi:MULTISPECIES: hypothetical protein [Clostridia]|mgnify:CR=1 FL=1|uniref:hypothetical protein n=1 Tax=Clostridia TaxID=186801 RepID=UPI000E471923|nr:MULTISPECIES: hypothetical protein [Clostridia]RHV70226.1 hypothetical protein DXB15_07965 [Roseburia sp. OM02-15]
MMRFYSDFDKFEQKARMCVVKEYVQLDADLSNFETLRMMSPDEMNQKVKRYKGLRAILTQFYLADCGYVYDEVHERWYMESDQKE